MKFQIATGKLTGRKETAVLWLGEGKAKGPVMEAALKKEVDRLRKEKRFQHTLRKYIFSEFVKFEERKACSLSSSSYLRVIPESIMSKPG